MGMEAKSDNRPILEVLAWFCWAAPAAVGVAATVLKMPLVGVVNLAIGIYCFILGMDLTLRTVRRTRILLVVLLLSNFPLALLCMEIGSRSTGEDGCAVVEVVNKSSGEIETAAVKFGNKVEKIGPIPIGGKRFARSPVITTHIGIYVTAVVAGKELSFTLGAFDSDDIHDSGAMIVDVFDDDIRWAEPRWRERDWNGN
jgi:hypothetical protein